MSDDQKQICEPYEKQAPTPTVTTSGDETVKYFPQNHCQRMRKRNNEAVKRCRLKQRIQQVSLEKMRLLLANQNDILKNRVAKLHKIKEILKNACNATNNDSSSAECLQYCNQIKCCQKDMPDCDISNLQLIKKLRFIRETNLVENATFSKMQDQHNEYFGSEGDQSVSEETNITKQINSLIPQQTMQPIFECSVKGASETNLFSQTNHFLETSVPSFQFIPSIRDDFWSPEQP